MWLDIDVFCSEELLGSVDRQIFDLVDEFLSRVISLSWVSFRILVGEY